jgi:tripeptidyl-peptidase-1
LSALKKSRLQVVSTLLTHLQPCAEFATDGGQESPSQAAYLTRFNIELQKAGTRGLSVMVSAGDSGVGCSRTGLAFAPNYPAAFPAITTVGGTTNPDAESVWPQGGGGFSNVFPRPKWQADAVESYLGTGAGKTLPPASYFNSSGRGYPDVTAMSTGFVVYQGGNATVADGTSASCPFFAGVIARLNAERFAVGKSALGFLNPWLYSLKGKGFTDITAGNNGCGDAQECCGTKLPANQQGFAAVVGWDPASGWGSPSYEGLLAAALAK